MPYMNKIFIYTLDTRHRQQQSISSGLELTVHKNHGVLHIILDLPKYIVYFLLSLHEYLQRRILCSSVILSHLAVHSNHRHCAIDVGSHRSLLINRAGGIARAKQEISVRNKILNSAATRCSACGRPTEIKNIKVCVSRAVYQTVTEKVDAKTTRHGTVHRECGHTTVCARPGCDQY